MNTGQSIVTKIEIQKNDKKRVNVYINEEFAFACSMELIYTYNIIKGKNIRLEYLKKIVDEDNYIKCKNAALKVIEKSYKTEKQIVDKLTQKEYESCTIQRVVDFLKEYNFINDEKFTQMYINEKIKLYGRNKIRYGLMKKGICQQTIEYQLQKIDPDVEKSFASKVAKKKYDLIKKTEASYGGIYKKLGNYLITRGYDTGIIRNVLNNMIDKDEFVRSADKIRKQKLNDGIDELRQIAEKRYNLLLKSESDPIKIYKKLTAYLIRRGYTYDDVKEVLKSIVNLF